MPAKQVKYCIKVFTLCCAETGVILSFEIYTGKDNTTEGGMVELVEKLITKCGLNDVTGRILYTDNYYTSMKLARSLYEKYKWQSTVSPEGGLIEQHRKTPMEQERPITTPSKLQPGKTRNK